MATHHKQEFSILKHKTRSVTIYPKAASIVRDITGVVVKPGTNEYTINNISSSAQESSFRVEGHGTSAVITDMSVELIPANPNNPNHQTPDSSDDDSDADDDSANSKELAKVEADIAALGLERDALAWRFETATNSVLAMESYGRWLVCMPTNNSEAVPVKTMEQYLTAYNDVRENCGSVRQKLVAQIRAVESGLTKLANTRDKLVKRLERERSKKLAERQKRKNAVKDADDIIYPYYRLKVTVEAGTLPADAPSVVASVDTGKPQHSDDDLPPQDADGPSLRISYMVHNASWLPKYELRFDTIARSGTLTFRAEATNRTNEQWSEAKVTLSTVQTLPSHFSSDRIPELTDWKIGLGKKSDEDDERDRYSLSEWSRVRAAQAPTGFVSPQGPPSLWAPGTSMFSPTQRTSVFGTEGNGTGGGLFGNQSASSGTSLFGMPASAFGTPAPASGTPASAFGAPAFGTVPTGSGFGATSATDNEGTEAPVGGGLFGNSRPLPTALGFGGTTSTAATPAFGSSAGPALVPGLFAALSSAPPAPALPFQPAAKMMLATSTASTYGINTSFLLPGTKTLPTSTTPLRFVVSETPLDDVEMAYTIVPKLRLAAFLTAAISLPSSLNVPALDMASLIVDGAFVGRSSIAPDTKDEKGRIFVSLGVDPALEVAYDKPMRTRESRGFLRAEEIVTYSRAWEVRNRKTQSVCVVVRDQVPVVEEASVKDRKMELVVAEPERPDGDGAVDVARKEGGEVEWRFELKPAEKRREKLEWKVVVEKGEEGVVSLS